MFRQITELKSLLKARTIALEKAEKEVEKLKVAVDNRDKFIEIESNKKDKTTERLKKAEDLIDKIQARISVNKYNNEKIVVDKIKELISDYQNNN